MKYMWMIVILCTIITFGTSFGVEGSDLFEHFMEAVESKTSLVIPNIQCKSCRNDSVRCSGNVAEFLSKHEENISFSLELKNKCEKPSLSWKLNASDSSMNMTTALLPKNTIQLNFSKDSFTVIIAEQLSIEKLKSQVNINIVLQIDINFKVDFSLKFIIQSNIGNFSCPQNDPTSISVVPSKLSNSTYPIAAQMTRSISSTPVSSLTSTTKKTAAIKPTKSTVTASKSKTIPTTKTTTKKTTLTTRKTKTESSENDNGHSKPARIVLIVLAVIILTAAVAVCVYWKRKPRLSDQPAYYNDIAINDPLRTELDEEDIHNNDGDDDELPLF